MVSPLNSLIAGGRAPNMAGGLGDLIRQQSLTDSSLKTQGLQQERMQQQIDQASQPPGISKEQSLGAAKYLNSLGKQLLSTDESQWGQILGPNVPQLQQLGYTPEMLQGMTREQVEGVVGQTEPLINQNPNQTSVQSSESLSGGLTKIVTRDGRILVKDASGAVLTGEEAINKLEEAEQRKIDLAGKKAEAVETSKLSVKRDIQPQIVKAVKAAEAEATAKGETLTDLNRMNAAMPGLEGVVSKLKDLSSTMTSTLGGRVFDTAARELGFGGTKGGTSRAKFVAIVNNQVLPLLKQTFGGAFTIQEGEKLAATLGSPNLSHAERVAELDAFIEAKRRDIEAKGVEVGQSATPELTDEELLNKYGIE